MSARSSVLPTSCPPRGLSRVASAEYIGLGVTKFDEMVADGRMPSPRRIDARKVWDRLELDLIKALEEAEKRSRELDARINLHFHHDREYLWRLSGLNAQRSAWKEADLDREVLRHPSEYALDRPVTTSLDAALALAARVLDLHCAVVESSPQSDHPSGQKACASVHLMGGGGSGRIGASTPALALCAAILRASEQERGQ